MPLPNQVIQAKNELSSTSPFIWLFTINLGQDTFRFARNTSDIVYNSQTFVAMPIDIGLIKSDDSGKIQSVSVGISNIGLALGNLADQLVGAAEKSVTLTLVTRVNNVYYQVFSIQMTIIGATVDEKYVTFELGFQNLLTQKFPQLVFTPNQCQWPFKGAECGYTGSATKCKKTFEECCNFPATDFFIAKRYPSNNCRPFGGFPAIRKGVRIVK